MSKAGKRILGGLRRELARSKGAKPNASEVERLRYDCAEAYQILAALAAETGHFEHPDVERALDNLNAAASGEPRPHNDLLPWPKTPPR